MQNSPVVKDGFYRIPIQQMDIVQDSGDGLRMPFRRGIDPFDTEEYGADVQRVIDYIEELKASGRNLKPVKLGRRWSTMTLKEYIDEFLSKMKGLNTSVEERKKRIIRDIEFEKTLMDPYNVELTNTEIQLNIAQKNGDTETVEALKWKRDALMDRVSAIRETIKILESELEKIGPDDDMLQLNPLFQRQLKRNLENATFYRSGNVTLIVPPEYRHRSKTVRELSEVVEDLQRKYGTETPVEVSLYTRSPGEIALDRKDDSSEGIWSVAGWAVSDNLAQSILIGVDGQRILTGVSSADRAGWSMPASSEIPSFFYTMAHEWGHARDFNSATDEDDRFSGMTARIAEYFAANPDVYQRLVSEYGKSATWEATAELFAQMFLQETFSIGNINIPQEILDILKQ